MSNPLPNSEKFLIERLKAHVPLMALVAGRVYVDTAPRAGEVYPCVIISLYSHSDSTAVGENKATFELPTYTIKGVAKGEDYGVSHEVADQLDEALADASGVSVWKNRTYNIQGIRRTGQRFAYSERDSAGTRFIHVGATYELFVSGERRS